MADGTAKKRDPEKWARAKAKARKKMGGHSARAMQIAGPQRNTRKAQFFVACKLHEHNVM